MDKSGRNKGRKKERHHPKITITKKYHHQKKHRIPAKFTTPILFSSPILHRTSTHLPLANPGTTKNLCTESNPCKKPVNLGPGLSDFGDFAHCPLESRYSSSSFVVSRVFRSARDPDRKRERLNDNGRRHRPERASGKPMSEKRSKKGSAMRNDGNDVIQNNTKAQNLLKERRETPVTPNQPASQLTSEQYFGRPPLTPRALNNRIST